MRLTEEQGKSKGVGVVAWIPENPAEILLPQACLTRERALIITRSAQLRRAEPAGSKLLFPGCRNQITRVRR